MLAGTCDRLPTGAAAVQSALERYFKGSGDAVVSSVDKALAGIEAILADDGSRFSYESSSSNALARLFERGASAVAHPLTGPHIYLTPSFFDGSSLHHQIETLVHEPAHLLWKNVFPPQLEAYGERVRRLSRRQALNNADSYTQFVLHRRDYD
jgi:hypothetical protein